MDKLLIRRMLMCLSGVLVVSCTTVEPPSRPVGYMVPTVRTGTSLGSLAPREISSQALAICLRTNGCMEPLVNAGMLPHELEIVSRGLASKGYAEIDARNARGLIRWLAFSSHPNGMLEIRASFAEQPPAALCGGLSPEQEPDQVTRQSNAFGDVLELSTWRNDTMSLRRIAPAKAPKDPKPKKSKKGQKTPKPKKEPVFWEIIWWLKL